MPDDIKRCADCCYWGLKRGKDGRPTGEHLCFHSNTFRTEWQPVESCSAFMDKSLMPDLLESLKYVIRELNKAGIIKANSIFMETPNRVIERIEGERYDERIEK